MKKVKPIIIVVFAVLLCVLTGLGVSGCKSEPEPTPAPPTLPPPPEPSTPEPTPEPVTLAPYSGIVETIAFHEVIAWPEIAFTGSRREFFDAEHITAVEFWNVLKELHRNDYVLINLNDVYSEYMTETGHYKMRQNTMEIPEGKKPLVITFDNMNFSASIIQHGFMLKYIIGPDGEIWAEGVDPNGNNIISQDLTAITLLDKFVKENPTFSHNGAKGCLALTGAQGILGHRTQKVDVELEEGEEEPPENRIFRMQEVATVTPVVAKLKETGWYFGSHTYNRFSLGDLSLERVQEDAERWLSEVGSLVGETQILTYPAGSRLDGGDQGTPGPALQYYVGIGFRYFAAQGSQYHVKIKSDDYNLTAVTLDRAYVCGTTFRYHRTILQRFFEVETVIDPVRLAHFEYSWE